jgi:hypothetical protein
VFSFQWFSKDFPRKILPMADALNPRRTIDELKELRALTGHADVGCGARVFEKAFRWIAGGNPQ